MVVIGIGIGITKKVYVRKKKAREEREFTCLTKDTPMIAFFVLKKKRLIQSL